MMSDSDLRNRTSTPGSAGRDGEGGLDMKRDELLRFAGIVFLIATSASIARAHPGHDHDTDNPAKETFSHNVPFAGKIVVWVDENTAPPFNRIAQDTVEAHR
jgi:hypothetical protein